MPTPRRRLPGHVKLRSLLAERNEFPERSADIDARLRALFEREVSILVLDMCGFSRLTAEHGVMHYLAMIEQMLASATPAVVANGGRVIKLEADNLFATFPAPERALEAALDVLRAFDAVNAVVPPERDIFGSVGIGHGPTLVVDDLDLFGHEMNLACKLGEDVATQGQILLTPAAHALLPPGKYLLHPAPCTVGPMRIDAWRFEGRR